MPAFTQVEALEEVVVSASRIPMEQRLLPLSVSVVDQQTIQAARQLLGLDEALGRVPGLFFQNRYNFAQDLRVSIRGFGARANFGIRGIKLFADDIPLTMPDGQGNIDSIDLGSAERIEVIRGPVSAALGSAGGGAISIFTESAPQQPFTSLRGSQGEYDFGDVQLKAGGQFGALNALLNLSHTQIDGYRQQSAYRRSLFNGKFRYDFSPDRSLTIVANAVDSPRADDPGALNLNEREADPRQAAPRNAQFDAGEELQQQKLGVVWRQGLEGDQSLLLRSYLINRDFQNRLPFAINSNGQGGSVDLDRSVWGLGGQWTVPFAGGHGTAVLGFDLDYQRDLRLRYANNAGVIGSLTTRQDEDVDAQALFVELRWQLAEQWTLLAGARYDELEYSIRDRLALPGGSGQVSFDEFSPMLGLTRAIGATSALYANVSTAFETPTFTEFANPDGATGFNQSLRPQQATHFELGWRGSASQAWSYELAVFHTDVSDELVPFELTGSGQSFFQNAGESTHQGLEAALDAELGAGFHLSASYTWSDFEFDRFVDLDGQDYAGNRIPGVPEHQFAAELVWRRDGWLVAVDGQYVGSFWADNANTVQTDAYFVSNLRLAYRHEWNNGWIEPYAGVYNLLDEDYDANIRINATFGRYYEPAPQRNAYLGIELGWSY